MGHQPKKGPPSLEATVIAHHRQRYMDGKIEAEEFEEKVDEAIRNPELAFDGLRPIGGPMFRPFATEVIER